MASILTLAFFFQQFGVRFVGKLFHLLDKLSVQTISQIFINGFILEIVFFDFAAVRVFIGIKTIFSDYFGVLREDGFDITVASEIMAILCLSKNISDLKKKLGNIIIGYDYEDKPVTARQLKAEGAMAALLKDALKPNLVQTLEHNPVLVHGGPFANIAHGCNSVIATMMALKIADYVITEAGFAADLGAEKFLDIKCKMTGLKPAAVVVVATVRALKHHGGHIWLGT